MTIEPKPYTPSTEEVRMAYGDERCWDMDDPTHAKGCPQDAEFDRWLSALLRDERAKALEDAADAWHEEHSGTRPVPYNWLSRRAECIRNEGSTDDP